MEGAREEGIEVGWMEAGTEGGVIEEGWRKGWREGWLEGWWEGFRKGGMEAEMQGGMEVRGMEGGGMERAWREGWMDGRTEGWKQGSLEAGTEGGMEVGMLEGGMGKGRREGWREGWKDGWRQKWRKKKFLLRPTKDGGRDNGRALGIDGWDGGMGWNEGWRVGWKEGSTQGWLQGGLVGVMQGEMEEWKDLEFDIDKLETEMEVIVFIKKKIYHPSFESFLLKGRYKSNVNPMDKMKKYVNEVEKILPTTTFTMQLEIDKQVVFDDLVSLARSVVVFMGEIASSSQKQFPSYLCYHFRDQWEIIEISSSKIHETCTCWANKRELLEGRRKKKMKFMTKVIDAVRNPPIDLNVLPKLLLTKASPDEDWAVHRSLNYLPGDVLLLIKAFPALGVLKEPSEMVNFLLEATDQLDKPIKRICSLCGGRYEAILLIGSHLSFERSHKDVWERAVEGIQDARGHWIDYANFVRRILNYCINDLPEFLQGCILYLACYPIGYEIPATSLTKLWIAEEFVTPENGETPEETAQKYLEQFVQRSLVWVSMRSYSGAIKYCRVPDFIHELVIEEASRRKFWVVNPDKETMESRFNRVAIHHDDNNPYTEVKLKPGRSFLAFDFDRDVLGSTRYLRVLGLKNSAIQETTLSKLDHLQYLNLRGSNICTLPKNIGNMKVLQTLDVRDTSVETLPESLWTISTLRYIHVNSSPQILGPPPTANLSNLQILKTVILPESWLQTFPHSLINLQKLGLSNMDNPAYKPNPYWKSVSNLLSQVVNLLSMTIIGDIVPAEFVDTRAFPNLETLKSIKFEGKWNYWKLIIDNVKFPQNLTKLTLSKSGLKEDPMPRLERLQTLKYLSLKDGAYIGKKMVCSANRFPQLDFLELSELKNLEIWEADPMAMPQLTKLRVVECCKLENIPNLEHVTDKDIVT